MRQRRRVTSGDDGNGLSKLTNEAAARGAGWYGDVPVGAVIRCDERYSRRAYNFVAGAAA